MFLSYGSGYHWHSSLQCKHTYICTYINTYIYNYIQPLLTDSHGCGQLDDFGSSVDRLLARLINISDNYITE
jgi:hypothetical protein